MVNLGFGEDIRISLNGNMIDRLKAFKYCVSGWLSHSKKLYKSLVVSCLDYCDTVHITAGKDISNKLQLIQNVVCMTMLLSNHDFHFYNMHKELGHLYLSQKRYLHFSIQLQKTYLF